MHSKQKRAFYEDNGNVQFYILTPLRDEKPDFLITSDRPVIFGDDKGKPMPATIAPFYNPRSVVFPLSSDRLFVAHSGEFPTEIVENHNSIQMWLAQKVIVANSNEAERAKTVIDQGPWTPTIDEVNISRILVEDNLKGEIHPGLLISAGWVQEYYIADDGSLVRLWSDAPNPEWMNYSIDLRDLSLKSS